MTRQEELDRIAAFQNVIRPTRADVEAYHVAANQAMHRQQSRRAMGRWRKKPPVAEGKNSLTSGE